MKVPDVADLVVKVLGSRKMTALINDVEPAIMASVMVLVAEYIYFLQSAIDGKKRGGILDACHLCRGC